MIKLEFILALVFVVEAFLEKYVILLKNPYAVDYSELNKKEHQWSFIYSAVVVLGFCWTSGYWVLLPSLFLSRRIFFDYTLKLLRGRPFKEIQGDQFWDSSSRKLFGKDGGVKEAAVIVGLKIVLLFLTFKFFV